MAYEIKVLDTGDVELDSSFLVLAHKPGNRVWVPTFAHLILGAEPILVDTGFRDEAIMKNLHMLGRRPPEKELEVQLAAHGVKLKDIKYVLHTHLHIDHAGQDDKFPMTTQVVINRRELEFSVSGLMGEQYPATDIKHLIDRLHTGQAARLLDLDVDHGEEIIPGVICKPAGGHTEGSMNVYVETHNGIACICGDVVYDVHDQLVEPFSQVLASEPALAGNTSQSMRSEKAAVKKVLATSDYVLPIHDRPAILNRGKVAGRLKDAVPGDVVDSFPKRAWFSV